MKKKQLIAILATIATLCSVLCFTACDFANPTPDSGNTGNGNTPSGHKHSYTDTVIAPTCTTEGYTLHTCTCGDEYLDNATPLISHSCDWKITESSHKGTCSVCKSSLNEEHDWQQNICTVCGFASSYTIGLSYSEIKENNEVIAYTIIGIGSANVNEVIIPSTHNGKPVTGIDHNAFAACRSLTSIEIPNSVTDIGHSAFEGCNSLTSVTIGNGVTSIGDMAFGGCSSLTSVTIGNSVTCIGVWAFSGCRSLTNIEIPNSVTSIGESAFDKCSSLTSVTIGNGVTSIGDMAFQECSSLESITIVSGNKVYHSRGNCIIETESKTLISGCKNSIIPTDGSVTSIGDYAFQACSSLTSIEIPNSVTSIGDWAFAACSSLTSVTIGNGVTSMGANVFNYCSSLMSVTIGNGVTCIGDWAFNYCGSLTSIEIPNSVTSIGHSSFYYCSSLTNIDIPNSVTSIGSNVFNNTAYYKNESNWENGVLYIGKHLIEAKDNIQGSYTIKAGTLTIADYAFSGCSSLTSIEIPDSVTSICDYAFSGCSSLTSVTIGNSVISIGSGAFYYCSSLTSIEIPNSVTSIGDWAFYECGKLTRIDFKGTKEQWKSIKKISGWTNNTVDFTVHCTDGDLTKAQSVYNDE